MPRADFVRQLEELGYKVEGKGDDRIAVRYQVPVGRYLGQEVWLGFRVGEDFPMHPPSGPHIFPRLLPQNPQSGPHPTHGIHASPFGDDWQYWSRPFKEWDKTNRSVKAYMAHIRHLFDTQ